MSIDWATISQLLMGGGVLYLIIDRFLLGKKEKVGINSDILGNGQTLVELYKQVDVIITAKTDPLNDKIDQLAELVQKYGCYRDECRDRISSQHRAHQYQQKEEETKK